MCAFFQGAGNCAPSAHILNTGYSLFILLCVNTHLLIPIKPCVAGVIPCNWFGLCSHYGPESALSAISLLFLWCHLCSNNIIFTSASRLNYSKCFQLETCLARMDPKSSCPCVTVVQTRPTAIPGFPLSPFLIGRRSLAWVWPSNLFLSIL